MTTKAELQKALDDADDWRIEAQRSMKERDELRKYSSEVEERVRMLENELDDARRDGWIDAGDLSDRIRELQAERDGLAALVEAAREWAIDAKEYDSEPGDEGDAVWRAAGAVVIHLIAQSPADALARHDAEVAARTLEQASDATEHEAPGEPYAGATFEAHAAWLSDRAKAIRDGDTKGHGE